MQIENELIDKNKLEISNCKIRNKSYEIKI